MSSTALGCTRSLIKNYSLKNNGFPAKYETNIYINKLIISFAPLWRGKSPVKDLMSYQNLSSKKQLEIFLCHGEDYIVPIREQWVLYLCHIQNFNTSEAYDFVEENSDLLTFILPIYNKK